MKLRTKEQGIVLVVTLIMLSVVTLMAIVFLGVSRRERATVTVTSDQITAKLTAEAGMARAQSEVVGRILSASNRYDFDYAVSTNFFNPAGFNSADITFNPHNVNYFLPNGNSIRGNDNQAVNIGNQLHDPRPPVYFKEKAYNPRTRQFEENIDFRFYLDFNRNRRFDPTGLLPALDENNRQLRDMESSLPVWSRYVGDPQWVGVLEYPGKPHSATNRFIGRFAYIIVPEGRSLDLNAIHNQVKQLSNTQDFFVRNQGIGPWEMNLGAFLRDLNPRIWTQYQYAGPLTLQENTGNSFRDAFSLLNYRRANRPLSTLNLLANPSPAQLQQDFVDSFANGPYLLNTPWLAQDVADSPDRTWWGSDYWRAFFDVQELFNGNKIPNASGVPASSDSVSDRIGRIPGLAQTSTYDRYTYYRLISQLGTASIPDTQARSYRLAVLDEVPQLREVRTNKLHLNYNNHSNHQTNYTDWQPRQLFMLSAQRLLMANLSTNPPPLTQLNVQGQQFSIPGTNFHMVGDSYVNRNFALTNIQVWPEKTPGVHEYTANVHQLLQLAANMTDPVTTMRPRGTFAGGNTEHFPLVFRPRYNVREDGSVAIFDFVEVTNDAPAQLSKPYRDLRFSSHRSALNADDNVFGIPWVVAAKKGLPNFNEYGVLTTMEITRKLEINKTAPNAPMNLWQTNQMIVMGISNMFGLETWNSYRSNYPRALRLQAQVQCSMVVTNTRGMLLRSNWFAPVQNRLLSVNEWEGNEFIVPMQQTFITLTNSIYEHVTGRLVEAAFVPRNLFPDRNIFPTPQIGLAMTNRVQCIMLDEETRRVIDYVNLDNLVTQMDVTQELLGAYSAGAQSMAVSSSSADNRMFWLTNRLGNANVITAPTEGVINQIFTSLDEIPVSQQLWNSFRARGTGRDREESIDLFRTFLGFPPKYLSGQQLALGFQRLSDPRKSFVRQVPFTPSLKKIIYNTWQANDPLVHYTPTDLRDLEGRATRSELVDPPDRPLNNRIHNIGLMNARYRPWPTGNGGDISEYNIAFKDPLIRQSDDWQFPTNRFPNIGWLGRLHRGTPWQTVYLKSAIGTDGAGRILNITDLPELSSPVAEGFPFQTLTGDPNTGFFDAADAAQPVDGSRVNVMAVARRNWLRWSGSVGTHPTNDWKILEQFTTALDDNAARGLLSVNQPGLAAWSALLSGVVVQTNSPTADVMARDLEGLQFPEFQTRTIEPAGLNGLPENQSLPSPMSQMVNGPFGINGVRRFFPNGRFQHLGDVLSAPALTLQSPFLASNDPVQFQSGIDDFAYERIPQQILSLLKADEPMVTIYAYGQALRPAEQSLRTDPEPPRLFNICTNYQVAGEYLFRRVVRFDGSITNLQATVESETVLPFD
jgi:hypothetical protein